MTLGCFAACVGPGHGKTLRDRSRPLPGARCRMDSRPPAHWLVAFSLPFCGSATAYESQTLAAFGEKEHHTAIAVEALSLSNASASQRAARRLRISPLRISPLRIRRLRISRLPISRLRIRRLRIRRLRPTIRLLIPRARIFIFSIFDGSDGTADSCPRNCVTSVVPTWHQGVHAEPIIHHITSSHTLFSRVNYYYYFFVKNDSLSEIGCIGQASDTGVRRWHAASR